MTHPVWVDGRIVEAEAARVSALDLGLRSGIGVFETLRVRSGATFRLAAHLARARTGAASLGIALEPEELAAALDELLDEVARRLARPRSTLDDLIVRLTVTAGPIDAAADFPPRPLGRPTRILTLHPAPPLPLPPARAITVSVARALAATKSTSYAAAHLAQRTAEAAGADVALLVEDGRIVEAANGNALALVGGVLVAPPVGDRALAGVTRAALVELVASGALPDRTVEERELDLDALAAADAVLVTSAVAGLRDVIAVDGAPVGLGRGGAEGARLVQGLRDAFDALVARESAPPGGAGGPH